MCSDSHIKNLLTSELVKARMVSEHDDRKFDSTSEPSVSGVLPLYKRPDPYSGVMEQIRQSMLDDEIEMLEAKKLFSELQKKVERLVPTALKSSLESPTLDFIRSTIDLPESSVTGSPFLPAKSFKDTTCEVCGVSFATVQSKVRHAKRIHPNDIDKIKTSSYAKSLLPYECIICQKAFATAASLAMHKRRHDQTLPRYSCDRCQRSYILPSELRKHVKNVHGEHVNSTSTSRPSSCSTFGDLECDDMPDI